MPVYEYTCSKCSIYFEEIVSAQKADDVSCPRCGASECIERVVTGFSIRPGGKGLSYNQMRRKAYGKE